MYGRPRDCKGKCGREDKSAQMDSSIRAKMLSSAKISFNKGEDVVKCEDILPLL